jgi:CheY-like chemotaxis protein
VAHDFNNLLAVVLGNLELIAERAEEPTIGRMAQSAINATNRGAVLTQRLLAYSRKQTLSPKLVELNELVSGMTELLRRTIGEPIEIDVAGGGDLWRCEADPGQLESAVLNLALNARDAMPQGGKMTIETSNVTLTDGDVAAWNGVLPGEYAMVSVSDTGAGMSRDVIDHAFEPFFTTKDVGAGSGLGLSMVQGFINQSGGHVMIDSAEGTGTTVKLYLPRKVGTYAAARHSPKEEDPLSQGERVLVVEDDPDVRKLTVDMLADLGYDTVEAADGQAAIEVLKRADEIDLLFTDVVLPGGMSGIQIAEEAIEQFPGIKILLTSGYAETVLDQHGPVDENIQLITKPFRKATLAQTVRAILDQPVD